MVDPTTDNAQTWRDLADQLTPTQLDILGGAEQRPDTTTDELLEWARECIESNGEQAKLDARLAHLELPRGVTTTGGWDLIRADDGDACRSLEWSSFETAKAHVAIDGFQDENGDVTRGVSVYAKHGDLDELSVEDVRDLAQALTHAAAELQTLERRP